jgi:hypothetical protein
MRVMVTVTITSFADQPGDEAVPGRPLAGQRFGAGDRRRLTCELVPSSVGRGSGHARGEGRTVVA